jgi:hypothetical protein
MTDKEQLIELLNKFKIKYKRGIHEYFELAGKPYIIISGCGCYHCFTFEDDLNGGSFISHELSE